MTIICISLVLFAILLILLVYKSNKKEYFNNLSQKCIIPKGYWHNSCKEISFDINSGLLRAYCQKNNKTYNLTKININDCINTGCNLINNNGSLSCATPIIPNLPKEKSDYHDNVCRHVDIIEQKPCRHLKTDFIDNKVIISGQCMDDNMLYKYTSLDINKCYNDKCKIKNINGILTCQ